MSYEIKGKIIALLVKIYHRIFMTQTIQPHRFKL